MKNAESFLTDDNETIGKWADEILVQYRQKVGNIILPMDEKILVVAMEELKGIKIELEEKEKVSVHKNEGILMPKRGGFKLRYGANSYKEKERIFNPVARKRFTICHELGHILFYDCSHTIPRLSINPREHVCHEIARRLLLPKDTVKKKFSEEYNSETSLVPFLREFAKDAKVSLYPLAIRLTEDLSLLKDVMITFWKYKGDRSQPEICYEDFTPDSKTCPELRKFLPKYWRRHIHMKAWDEAVREVAITGTPLFKKTLYMEGKRRKKGKIKCIAFDIKCEPLVDLSNQLSLLKWTNQVFIYDVVSVEKFDLNILIKGKHNVKR